MIKLTGLEAEIASKSREVAGMNLPRTNLLVGAAGAALFPVIARLAQYLYEQGVDASEALPILTRAFGAVLASVSGSEWFTDENAEAMIEKLPQHLATALTESFNELKRDGRF